MTVLPPITKRVVPTSQGVRYVGFGHKLYRDMCVFDAQGDNGVDGEDDYRKGLNLTPAQEKIVESIGSGEFALRVGTDGKVEFVNKNGLAELVRRRDGIQS